MKLGIIGTGKMGKILYQCAEEDGSFDEIFCIEPVLSTSWPSEKMDLLIDFSNPEAIYDIYKYCRQQGGNIPLVLATTGYEASHREIIRLIQKICPVIEKTNFSKGVELMNKLASYACELLESGSEGDERSSVDIRISETHHKLKKDSPSGTAITLCSKVGITPEEYEEKVAVLRMGSIFGEHAVYFAMEDEVLEIRHRAYSKRIFALGALEEGKRLAGII